MYIAVSEMETVVDTEEVEGMLRLTTQQICNLLKVEILREQHRCELTGIVALEASKELKIILPEAIQKEEGGPEEQVFWMMFLDTIRNCRRELDQLEEVTDRFCAAYLEGLELSIPTEPQQPS